MIDIGDLDYEWQLSEGSVKLEEYVKSFKLYKIGLDDDVKARVCPEANIELYQCIESTTSDSVQAFYQDCLDYINEIFPRGADDLKQQLGTFSNSQGFISHLKNFFRRQIFPSICH